MKTTRFVIIAVWGALAGFGPLPLAGQVTNAQPGDRPIAGPANPVSPDKKTDSTAGNNAVKLSWGLDDIAKLSKAGVDESVILTFIQNSGTAYNATAQDVIQLRESGVSAPVITALMRRGGEVRQTAIEAQNQAQAAAAAQAASAAAATASAQTTAYSASPVYSAPVSTVTYIGYPRSSYPASSYGYGGGYSPSYYPGYDSYPRYYGSYGSYGSPRISFGLNFGGVRFGGFHGGFRGGFRHCR